MHPIDSLFRLPHFPLVIAGDGQPLLKEGRLKSTSRGTLSASSQRACPIVLPDQLHPRLYPGLKGQNKGLDGRAVVCHKTGSIAQVVGPTTQDDPVFLQTFQDVGLLSDHIAVLTRHMHIVDLLDGPSIDLTGTIDHFHK